jgi:hypothetical protein
MLAYLRDPDWWFTGLLGLIVISLIWSYARDAVAVLVGPVIPAVRRQREARRQRERKQVDLLASNPQLLLMELVRCLYLVVLFFALVGFYLFFAIIGTSLLRVPGIRDAGFYDLGLLTEISLVLGAALGLCSIYFGTPITPRLHTVMRARSEYENRCKREAAQPTPPASKPAPAARS